jgi:hypothetical protein
MRTRTQEREVKQPVFSEIKEKEVKILNLAVHLEKLTAQLNDGRELSIPIDWFAKWGVEGVSAEKLKNHEIWEGDEIYFPDIDEVLGMEVFIYGLNAPCE